MSLNTFDDKSILIQVMACCSWEQSITWAKVDLDLGRHNEIEESFIAFVISMNV